MSSISPNDRRNRALYLAALRFALAAVRQATLLKLMEVNGFNLKLSIQFPSEFYSISLQIAAL